LEIKKIIGYAFNTSADFETVRDIKEKCCMVSHDPKVDRILSSETTHYQMEYTLPDGSLINIGRERFEAAEVLFTPSICNLDFPGIPELVFNTIKVIFFIKISIGR
jgi:actin-related protein 2